MLCISYSAMLVFISMVWLLTRVYYCVKSRRCSLKRELQLLPVYICLIVVARFTFFPFGTVNGRIQPLVFDAANALNCRINLIPLVNLLDYENVWEIPLNVIGNFAMFVPIGIIWPTVFQQLHTHRRAIAAGIAFSACIEILQLPFFDRVTDVDDLILNSLGYLLGYGIYLAAKKLRRRHNQTLSGR
jgi:glycopeptide antibiotics resistance protein